MQNLKGVMSVTGIVLPEILDEKKAQECATAIEVFNNTMDVLKFLQKRKTYKKAKFAVILIQRLKKQMNGSLKVFPKKIRRAFKRVCRGKYFFAKVRLCLLNEEKVTRVDHIELTSDMKFRIRYSFNGFDIYLSVNLLDLQVIPDGSSKDL